MSDDLWLSLPRVAAKPKKDRPEPRPQEPMKAQIKGPRRNPSTDQKKDRRQLKRRPAKTAVEDAAMLYSTPDSVKAAAWGEVKDYWDMTGDIPVWTQPHDEVVRDALHSWKGDPISVRVHVTHAINHDPQPDSGSGKVMRAWAEALLTEIRGAPHVPMKLYRGEIMRSVPYVGERIEWLLRGAAPKRSVAKRFAKEDPRAYDTEIGVLRIITDTTGLHIADYNIGSGMDQIEDEYLLAGTFETVAVDDTKKPIEATMRQVSTTTSRWAKRGALEVTWTEPGEVGNSTHITMEERGTVPTSVIAGLQGVMGETPGAHRNKQGEVWEEFKAQVAVNGITNPIFITIDYGGAPRISEGNHRRDAAIELGLAEVPVLVRYFGHAEQRGTLLERSARTAQVHTSGWIRCSDGQERWGPYGAAGVLFRHKTDEGYEYLLAKRGAGTDDGGTWAYPGGALNSPGEDPEKAALREAREELGAAVPKTFHVVEVIEDRPCPEWAYWTVIAEVEGKFTGGEYDWETDEEGWFTAAEVANLNLHPAVQKIWPRLRSVARLTNEVDRAALRSSNQYFIQVAEPPTLSGWKAHIYCEDVEDVASAWHRVKLDADINDWGAKLATARFFEFAGPGHKQRGKGVTLYFPRRAKWEDDLAWLVRVMEGWPQRLCKPISGDTYAGNGVNWRFDLSEDPGYDIDPGDVNRWYQEAQLKTAAGAPPAPGIGWCKVCGTKIERIAAGKWRHSRSQPNGEMWDHKPVPGGQKEASSGWLNGELVDFTAYEDATLDDGTVVHFISYGDAVPGGYNGGWLATVDGAEVGHIDYQSGGGEVGIGMVEVKPEWRRRGVASALLGRLRLEFPGKEIDPGMTTPEGSAWWNKVGAEDYRGGHQPPDDGPPLHDLLAGDMFPDDVYEHPEYYVFGSGEAYDRESIKVLQAVRGKPEAMVTIYRAAPAGTTSINSGDWVAIAESYARQHAMRGDPEGLTKAWYDAGGEVHYEGDWPVLSAQVPARTVRNGGNDLIEYGYWGPTITAKVGSKTALAPVQGPITLYHGTIAKHVPAILQDGLRFNPSLNPWRWPMLTDSYEQASQYAQGEGDQVIVEFHLDAEQAARYLADAGEHGAYDFDAHAYGIKENLPPSTIVKVHPKVAALKTADRAPWRGQVPAPFWHLAEQVPVSTLAKMVNHKMLHEELGPLDATVEPLTIAWNPYTGRANVADGNHRITRALKQRLRTLPAVVWVACDIVFDRDFVFSAKVNPNVQRYDEWTVLAPSQVPSPTVKVAATTKSLDEAIEDLADVLVNSPSYSSGEGGLWGNRRERVDPDWASILGRVKTMYRGYGLRVTEEEYEMLTGTGRVVWDKGEYLLGLITKRGLGQHWTTNRNEAAGFAGMTADRGDLRVLLWADPPRPEDVLLGEEGTKGLGIQAWDDIYGEQEIPVRKGAPLHIKAIEWGKGGPRPMLRSDDGGGWDWAWSFSETKTALSKVRGPSLADIFKSVRPSLQINIVTNKKSMFGGSGNYMAGGSDRRFERMPGNLRAELKAMEREARDKASSFDTAKVIENMGGIERIVLTGQGNTVSETLLAEKRSWDEPWRAPGKALSNSNGYPIEADSHFYNVWQYGSDDELMRTFVVDVAGGIYDDSQFAGLDEGVTLTVYRGISMKPGDNVATSVDRYGGAGRSWTLREETAMAIAERGQAGFSGANTLTNDVYLVQMRELTSTDKATVPTVLRATVTLSESGAAPYRPWSGTYLSETEIDIPHGTEIVIDGWRQAELVPVNAVEKRKAEEAWAVSQKLEREDKYDDPRWIEGTHAGFYVHYAWGSWHNVKIQRTATEAMT